MPFRRESERSFVASTNGHGCGDAVLDDCDDVPRGHTEAGS